MDRGFSTVSLRPHRRWRIELPLPTLWSVLSSVPVDLDTSLLVLYQRLQYSLCIHLRLNEIHDGPTFARMHFQVPSLQGDTLMKRRSNTAPPTSGRLHTPTPLFYHCWGSHAWGLRRPVWGSHRPASLPRAHPHSANVPFGIAYGSDLRNAGIRFGPQFGRPSLLLLTSTRS